MGQCYAKKIPVVEDDLQHQPLLLPPPTAATTPSALPSPRPRPAGVAPPRSAPSPPAPGSAPSAAAPPPARSPLGSLHRRRGQLPGPSSAVPFPRRHRPSTSRRRSPSARARTSPGKGPSRRKVAAERGTPWRSGRWIRPSVTGRTSGLNTSWGRRSAAAFRAYVLRQGQEGRYQGPARRRQDYLKS
ncbi:uncharacterized protein [Elaeis guineensis]|uniref:uncharacterized protein n=1 Tax=Elaeis guineensis var. tenera TaxID=51953 RepID=UPI003C6D715C